MKPFIVAQYIPESLLLRLQRFSHWQVAIFLIIGGLGLMLISFWHNYVDIVKIWWKSETFAHGFLILPISVVLIWRCREQLQKFAPEPEWYALGAQLALILLWLMANLSDIQLIQHFSAVIMIPTLILTVLGKNIAKTIAFPLSYLIFAVPFGEFLIPYLQDITAEITVLGLQLSGIPVYLEGRYIYIPSGSFEVAVACSGIRYLIASVALGALYAYLNYKSIRRRIFFIIISLLVPIIANGIRAYGIVMIAHLSDYKLAVGVDHLIYGWLFFGFVMFLLFWIGNYFREDENLYQSVSSQENFSDTNSNIHRNLLASFVFSIVLIVSAPLSAALYNSISIQSNQDISLPETISSWRGTQTEKLDWDPLFVGDVKSAQWIYQSEQGRVDIYMAKYTQQKQGSELINAENRIYDSRHWQRISESQYVIESPDGENFSVHAIKIRSKEKIRVIWYWYIIDDYFTINAIAAKLQQLKVRLLGEHARAAAIIVSTELASIENTGQQILEKFIKSILPEITNSLGEVHRG